jgi:hypothetical protein
MPGTHQKTVTVVPVDDAYGWSVIDDATNSTATWITDGNTIGPVQQGTSDTWDFTVVDNPSSAARSATCTVTHSNGTTSDFFTIDQAGTGVSNTPLGSYTSVVANANPVNEGQDLTFTITGSNLSNGTVGYTISGTGITSNDIGISMNGQVTITGSTNSGTLVVPISADATTEGNETITLTLASQDSNSVSTNSLITNTVITDTSVGSTPVQVSFQNNTNITLNPNMAQWNVTAISLVSGTISNQTIGMSGVIAGAQFEAAAGEVVQLELTLTKTTGYQFTQVASNPVATLANSIAGLTKVSEDLTLSTWPDVMKLVVEYTVPAGNGVNLSQGINATTILAPLTDDFTFTGGDQSILGSFSITQNGSIHNMSLVNNNTSDLELNFDSNQQITMLGYGADISKPSWINFDPNGSSIQTIGVGGTIYFNVEANPGSSSRTGDIIYIGGQTLAGTGVNTVRVTQPGQVILGPPPSL